MEKITYNIYIQKFYVLLTTVGGNTISIKNGSLYLIFGAFAGLLFQSLKVRFDLNIFRPSLCVDEYDDVQLVVISFASVVDFLITYSGLVRTVNGLGSIFSTVISGIGFILPQTGDYNKWSNVQCISMLVLRIGSFSIFSFYSRKVAARVVCGEEGDSYIGLTSFCKKIHMLNVQFSINNRSKSIFVANQKFQKYLDLPYFPRDLTKKEIKILLERSKALSEISKEISKQVPLKQNSFINVDFILQSVEKIWLFLKSIDFGSILLSGMSSLFMIGCVRTDVRADFFSDLFTYDPANPTLLDQIIQIFFCSPSGLAVLFTTFKIAKAGFFSDFELDSGIISTFFVPLWIQCGQSGNYRYYLKGSNWRRLFVSDLVDNGARLSFMFKSRWFAIVKKLRLKLMLLVGGGYMYVYNIILYNREGGEEWNILG